MATKERIRIRLKAYDHTLIDQAAEKIVETAQAQRCGGFRAYPAADRPRDHHDPARGA